MSQHFCAILIRGRCMTLAVPLKSWS